MLYLIAIVPWVLTVAALFFIILHNKPIEEDNDDDLFMDLDDEGEEYQTIHVAVYNDKAYWVADNIFYESDVTKEPDFTTAKPIDTMDLPPKKLNELLIILDELKEYRKD